MTTHRGNAEYTASGSQPDAPLHGKGRGGKGENGRRNPSSDVHSGKGRKGKNGKGQYGKQRTWEPRKGGKGGKANSTGGGRGRNTSEGERLTQETTEGGIVFAGVTSMKGGTALPGHGVASRADQDPRKALSSVEQPEGLLKQREDSHSTLFYCKLQSLELSEASTASRAGAAAADPSSSHVSSEAPGISAVDTGSDFPASSPADVQLGPDSFSQMMQLLQAGDEVAEADMLSKDTQQENWQEQVDEVLALHSILAEEFVGVQAFKQAEAESSMQPDDRTPFLFEVLVKIDPQGLLHIPLQQLAGSSTAWGPHEGGDEGQSSSATPADIQPTMTVQHVPPLRLTIGFPATYPSSAPPKFQLAAMWLDSLQLTTLCEGLDAVWEASPGMAVVYAMIEYLRSAALGLLQEDAAGHRLLSLSSPEKPSDTRVVASYAEFEHLLMILIRRAPSRIMRVPMGWLRGMLAHALLLTVWEAIPLTAEAQWLRSDAGGRRPEKRRRRPALEGSGGRTRRLSDHLRWTHGATLGSSE
ncbi:hypothetical protein CYMTET_42189, partial [Cymbomonas tetramitiformis]